MTTPADQKQIYDEIYTNVATYNFYDDIKNDYVDSFARIIDGNILDAGCGEGIHLKRLLDKGYDVFGIEISEVCCTNFLSNTPHENVDIVTYSKKGVRYSGLICMDVLEHISPGQLDETIMALSQLAPTAFFGIANHSDILNGKELHLIREDSRWWVNILSKYYKCCYVVSELSYTQNNKIFFIVYCDNNDCIISNNQADISVNEQYGCSVLNYFKHIDQSIIDRLYKKISENEDALNSVQSQLSNTIIELSDAKNELTSTQLQLANALRIVNHPVVKGLVSIRNFVKKCLFC